jgi:hypothetical protein
MDHRLEADGQHLAGWHALPQRLRLLGDLHRDHRERVLGVEGYAAAGHFVQHHTEGIDVRARVGARARRLLGRHVVRGPDHGADGGELLPAVHDLGDAEIQNLHEPAAVGLEQEDVVGLEVAVDDPHGVRSGERLRNLAADVQSVAERDPTLAIDGLSEGDALQIFHHDVRGAVGKPSEIEHLHDVRAADRRGRLRLGHEPTHGLVVLSQILADDLESDRLIEHRMAAAINDAHRPEAEQALDQVAICYDFPQIRVRRWLTRRRLQRESERNGSRLRRLRPPQRGLRCGADNVLWEQLFSGLVLGARGVAVSHQKTRRTMPRIGRRFNRCPTQS